MPQLHKPKPSGDPFYTITDHTRCVFSLHKSVPGAAVIAEAVFQVVREDDVDAPLCDAREQGISCELTEGHTEAHAGDNWRWETKVL